LKVANSTTKLVCNAAELKIKEINVTGVDGTVFPGTYLKPFGPVSLFLNSSNI